MEREQETEFVCVVVFLCVSVCVRVPYGFCAGSSLIICIFSFELLFAALHAAQAPEGLPTNSVKRQVRHKLIMGCLRVIALLSHNHVWVCGTKKYRNTWRLSHTQKQEERATTHTHITEIQIESERRPRSSEEVFESIKPNYWAGWREVTFNRLTFEYKNFFDLKRDSHLNFRIHFQVMMHVQDSLNQLLIFFFEWKSSEMRWFMIRIFTGNVQFVVWSTFNEHPTCVVVTLP